MWPISFLCRVIIRGNAFITSFWLLPLTSFDYPPFIEWLLIIEIHSLAAICLDGLNWYCQAASQSRPSTDLPVAATKIIVLLISCFPTFSGIWINPAIFNGCWLKSTNFSKCRSDRANITSVRRISFKSFFFVNIVTGEPDSINTVNLFFYFTLHNEWRFTNAIRSKNYLVRILIIADLLRIFSKKNYSFKGTWNSKPGITATILEFFTKCPIIPHFPHFSFTALHWENMLWCEVMGTTSKAIFPGIEYRTYGNGFGFCFQFAFPIWRISFNSFLECNS